jgi:hypothetical protein
MFNLKDLVSNLIFSQDKKNLEEFLKDLQRTLIKADVDVKIVLEITRKIKEEFKEKKELDPNVKRLVISILYEELLKHIGEGKELIPISISSLRELTPGKFNIPEPPMDVKRVVKSIDVVFVPGLAFDLFGYRIGYGGGFYDRFLSKNPSSKKIGICFSFQLFSELPHDPFDVPVDYIVTDKNWTRRKEWRQS